MYVTRFTSSGMPDTAFSGDGLSTVPFPQQDSYAYSVVVRGGKIYLAGQVYESSGVANPVVVRMRANGTLDPTFGKGGRKRYVINDGFEGDDHVSAIVPVARGRFVLAGGVTTLQHPKTLVMRIKADGRLDRSFRGGGMFIMNVLKTGSRAAHIAMDGSKIVLGIAGTDGRPALVRLRADGRRDATFGTKGVGRYPLEGFHLWRIAVDGKHRVVAVGYKGQLPVFRVRANGRLATGFGTGGVATNPDAVGIFGSDVMMQGGLILVSGWTQSASIGATRYLP